MNKKTLNLSMIFFLCLVKTVASIQIEYSSFSEQGDLYTGKKNNEDYFIVKNINKNFCAGVFDGEGGNKVAKFASKDLFKFLIPYLTDKTEIKDIIDALQRGIVNFDVALYGNNEGLGVLDGSGLCFVYILNNTLYCANLGSSRAVLYTEENGKVMPTALSDDHKLFHEIADNKYQENTTEMQRIKKAGGKIQNDLINGCLAISRGLGFCYLGFKKVGELKSIEEEIPLENFPNHPVSNIPDVKFVSLKPANKFIVIASDGLWDAMSNEDVGALINENVKQGNTLEEITNALLAATNERWEKLKNEHPNRLKDDVSAIVIRLSDIQKEEFSSSPKLNKTLTFNQVCLIGGAGAVAVTGIWNWKRISKWWNNLGKNKNKDK